VAQVTDEGIVAQVTDEGILVGLARLEAILRAVHREALESTFPAAWAGGRKRKILRFCAEPRTQQEIRSHIGSIAGSEVKQYLEEGLRYGVMASAGTGRSQRYFAVLAPPVGGRRRGRQTVRRRQGRART